MGRRASSQIRGVGAASAQVDLEAELELARAEIARLRAEQQRVVDVDRATRAIAAQVGALDVSGEAGDGLLQLHAETLAMRTGLLELCCEVEKAMRALRLELETDTPLVETDRRRRADDVPVRGIAASNGHRALQGT